MNSAILSPKKIKTLVEKIRFNLVTDYSYHLLHLTPLIEQELKALKFEVPCGNIRIVADIANKHLFRGVGDPQDIRIKSVNSIIEKINRSRGKYTLENFTTEMPDIFRMRIICNYLSDVKMVARRLRESKIILKDFTIVKDEDKIIQNRINKMISDVEEKLEWIRLHSFVFKYKDEESSPMIEVQIMTMLQEAWDRKDHYLFYEPIREGINFPPEWKIKMNAMSELLYVADEFFDIIQYKTRRKKKR